MCYKPDILSLYASSIKGEGDAGESNETIKVYFPLLEGAVRNFSYLTSAFLI
jgi:hypothetical protein